MSRCIWFVLPLLCCLLLQFVAPESSAAALDRSCHVAGIETPVRCVSVAVPRDYARPSAATLTLTAVIVPATTGKPAPDPLIMLAGGPGQAATDLPLLLPALLKRVLRQRDVILFDVRGTGLSEALHCELPESALGSAAAFAELRAAASRCAQLLGQRARYHTNREVVQDLERLRDSLGLQQINLWGGSFGTRIAQHYVRSYGKHVRAIVLDGVTPTGTSALVTGAHSADAALAKLIERCRSDAHCQRTFPDLDNKLQRLLAAADERPATITTTDALSGSPSTLQLDYFLLSQTLRNALYSRLTTELLPFAIDAAAADNFTPLLGIAGAFQDQDVDFGAQLSMLCAEDWPLARAAGAAARTGKLMREGYYTAFANACEVWTQDTLPATMLTPVSSAVPALAISGDSDPVTPPELATQALARFAHAVHLIVPRGFHINSHIPCVAQIAAQFLADPNSGDRNHQCVEDMSALRFVTGPSS